MAHIGTLLAQHLPRSSASAAEAPVSARRLAMATSLEGFPTGTHNLGSTNARPGQAPGPPAGETASGAAQPPELAFAEWSVNLVSERTRATLSAMWNLGLNRGLPKQVLTHKERLALFDENQKGVKLTRVPGDQFLTTPTEPTLARPAPAEAGGGVGIHPPPAPGASERGAETCGAAGNGGLHGRRRGRRL